MSQTKVQLVAPVGIVTASGVNVSGTITATSYSGSGANLTGVGVGTTASVNTSGIVTAVSFSGSGANLTNAGIGTTGSINTSGIITAASFYGDGTNLTGITLLGPTNSLNTSGIITAGSFYGDGAGITNIGGRLEAISYSPGIGETNVGLSSNIVITFNKPIAGSAATAGIASVTLRTGSASGTIVETFDVATSTALSISGGVLTINPTANLSELTTYFVVVPAGTFQDTLDTSDNIGITTYSFTSQEQIYIRELWTWGINGSEGRMGLNDTVNRSSPIQVPGTQWSSASHVYYGSSASKTDGTLWGWGNNYSGQLGQNNRPQQYSSPRQIPGTQWSKALSATYNTFATKTDGTLWAIGNNSNGELGQNNNINRSSPVQIPGTQWSNNISHKRHGMYGIKTDGTLWSWGSNAYGFLGINDVIYRSSPTQIPGTQWSKIGGGHFTLGAIKTDGTLWSWGYGDRGQLGQNDLVTRSSPTQIPGTQWSYYDSSGASNARNSYGIKTDGTLWAWGDNGYGELGQNNLVARSSPTQIPGTQWNAVSSNYRFTIATKTDGTLWSLGYNANGQLGINDKAYRSSPVQVPGTQWSLENFENQIGPYAFAMKKIPQ